MKKSLLFLIILTVAFGCAQQRTVTPPFDLPSGVTYETDDSGASGGVTSQHTTFVLTS